MLRSIESSAKPITPSVVDYFRGMDFAPADKMRYEQLVETAIFGVLDEKQRTDFENYRRVKLLLDLVREKVLSLAGPNDHKSDS